MAITALTGSRRAPGRDSMLVAVGVFDGRTCHGLAMVAPFGTAAIAVLLQVVSTVAE